MKRDILEQAPRLGRLPPFFRCATSGLNPVSLFRPVTGEAATGLGDSRVRVRLPAAIARQAHLNDNQTMQLKVIPEGVLIRPVQPRLSLAERLAAYGAMPGEPTEAY